MKIYYAYKYWGIPFVISTLAFTIFGIYSFVTLKTGDVTDLVISFISLVAFMSFLKFTIVTDKITLIDFLSVKTICIEDIHKIIIDKYGVGFHMVKIINSEKSIYLKMGMYYPSFIELLLRRKTIEITGDSKKWYNYCLNAKNSRIKLTGKQYILKLVSDSVSIPNFSNYSHVFENRYNLHVFYLKDYEDNDIFSKPYSVDFFCIRGNDKNSLRFLLSSK